MAVTGIQSNHYKIQKHKGQINYKAQSHNLSLTFSNAADTIVRGADSFITDGFEVGDRIYTNSANAGNKGPFIVKAVVALTLTIMNLDGTSPALTDGTENNLTVGTYLLECRLMRSGFVFNKDDHEKLINIETVKTASTIAFVDGGGGNDSITDSGNGFLTAGLVAGNRIVITGSASNNITVIALSVTAGTIEVATGTLTTEAAGASVTLTSNDELATGVGYTRASKLSGIITISEDDTNDRANMTCPTVTWTASGGSIGPTPGMLILNRATTDNTIVGYINFGAEETATDGTTFDVAAVTLRDA